MEFIAAWDLACNNGMTASGCAQNNLGLIFALLVGFGTLLYALIVCYTSYIYDRYDPEDSKYSISFGGKGGVNLRAGWMIPFAILMGAIGGFIGFVIGVLPIFILVGVFSTAPVISSSILAAMIIIPTLAKVHRLAIRTNKIVKEHIDDKKIHRSD